MLYTRARHRGEIVEGMPIGSKFFCGIRDQNYIAITFGIRDQNFGY